MRKKTKKNISCFFKLDTEDTKSVKTVQKPDTRQRYPGTALSRISLEFTLLSLLADERRILI